MMQHGHTFVCSVARGVERGTPMPAAATDGGWQGIDSVPAGQRRPPLPPTLAIGRGGPSEIFLTFSWGPPCCSLRFGLEHIILSLGGPLLSPMQALIGVSVGFVGVGW